MPYRNLIFDLDGTLIDSIPGIEYSVRAALARVLPQIEMPDLRPLVGPPLRTMFRRLWPELGQEDLELLLQEFRLSYDEEGCLTSRPYGEADQALRSLKESGRNLYLLTNKPVYSTFKILNFLGWTPFFSAIHNPDMPDQPFSSKEEGAQFLMRKHSIEPAEACLIGDSLDDAVAAHGCGFSFVAVSYGYGQAAQQCEYPFVGKIESLSQLRELLLKQEGISL